MYSVGVGNVDSCSRHCLQQGLLILHGVLDGLQQISQLCIRVEHRSEGGQLLAQEEWGDVVPESEERRTERLAISDTELEAFDILKAVHVGV